MVFIFWKNKSFVCLSLEGLVFFECSSSKTTRGLLKNLQLLLGKRYTKPKKIKHKRKKAGRSQTAEVVEVEQEFGNGKKGGLVNYVNWVTRWLVVALAVVAGAAGAVGVTVAVGLGLGLVLLLLLLLLLWLLALLLALLLVVLLLVLLLLLWWWSSSTKSFIYPTHLTC